MTVFSQVMLKSHAQLLTPIHLLLQEKEQLYQARLVQVLKLLSDSLCGFALTFSLLSLALYYTSSEMA